MNEEENQEFTVDVETSPEVNTEVGVSEEVFIQRMDSAENLLIGNLVCTALVVGAVMATLVMRFYHVH